MTKLKDWCLTGLTLLVVMAGAFLPTAVFRIMDHRQTNVPELADISTVQLEIREELTPLQKLMMLEQSDGLIRVAGESARMTEEEVLAAARRQLQPYVDTGLIPQLGEDVEIKPYLAQVQAFPELQDIVWSVYISGGDKTTSVLDLVLDDRSGQILQIVYGSDLPMEWGIFNDGLGLFADIFFAGLEVENYGAFYSSDLEHAYVGDNANAVRYAFEDIRYGELNVDFYLHTYGFYTILTDK